MAIDGVDDKVLELCPHKHLVHGEQTNSILTALKAFMTRVLRVSLDAGAVVLNALLSNVLNGSAHTLRRLNSGALVECLPTGLYRTLQSETLLVCIPT